MTPAIKRIKFAMACFMMVFLAAGGSCEQVNHWDSDNGTCYSTLQRGCLDSLMGWE